MTCAAISAGNAAREKERFPLVYDDLEIGDVIGQGSSSVVIRAKHSRFRSGRDVSYVALKVISAFEKSKRDQLIREISALYDCNCSAVVGFYGAFYREVRRANLPSRPSACVTLSRARKQGAITIALEYMDGGSLANVIAQVGPVEEAALSNVAVQVLWALSYLKRQKRVHRDIKPSNLLINSRGEVKVTDFGVSAELQNSIAMCGTFVGTFKYMSPERIQSQPYSYASDIWSLGLVLLECSTGRYPYPEDATCIGMAQTIIESPVPKPPATHFSSEFCDLIAQTLQKDPSQRLPPEILITAPWMQMHGGTAGLEAAITNVAGWIRRLQSAK